MKKILVNFLNTFYFKWKSSNFNSNNVFIGSELAFNHNLKEGDNLSLMSSAFVMTPFGKFTKTRKLSSCRYF